MSSKVRTYEVTNIKVSEQGTESGSAPSSLFSTSALWRLLVLVQREAYGAKDLRFLQAMTPGRGQTNHKYGKRRKKQEQVNSRPQCRRGDQKKKRRTEYRGSREEASA